jgi:predicted metal-dependent enzyme (double-stranded beta helix superfamily)
VHRSAVHSVAERPLVALAGVSFELASMEAFLLGCSQALARHAVFDPAGPCRLVLGATEELELTLVAWLPGQQTEVHEHAAPGALRVLSGVLREDRYLREPMGGLEPDGWTLARERALLRTRCGAIHRVRNPLLQMRAVTLHLAPR